MTSADILRLLSLAMIWGGSFIFMRVLAPVLGPIVTADLRVLIAGVFLVSYFKITRFDLEISKYWKNYLIIGILNSALPFVFFCFAALHLPASYSAILNSSSPLFGAVFAYFWMNEALNPKKVFGLLLGATGVGFVARIGPIPITPIVAVAMLACLLSAICYGLCGIYIKKFCTGAKSKAIAGVSQLFAGLVLLPFAIPYFDVSRFSPFIAWNIAGLALACSAIAYLIYYRLIADLGPTKALTVTFLVPGFGILWGYLFLKETVTLPMAMGCGLIILGTSLVLNVLKVPNFGRAARG